MHLHIVLQVVVTIDQIPLSQLIAPCIVIDVSEYCDERYRISIKDIKKFETHNFPIPQSGFIMIKTGRECFITTYYYALNSRLNLQALFSLVILTIPHLILSSSYLKLLWSIDPEPLQQLPLAHLRQLSWISET